MSGGVPAVLAIDGGNSKTDVALVAADGTVRGRARGPGVPTKLSGQTVAMLAPVVRAAAAGAGLAGAGLAGARGPAVAGHTVACMANADLPEEEELLGEMLGAQGWSASTQVAMRRLGLTGLATPVVLGGGLLTARDPLLTGWITERLAAAAPAAAVHIVDIPPIAGAALMGLDHTGAGAAAQQRLRAGYLVPGLTPAG